MIKSTLFALFTKRVDNEIKSRYNILITKSNIRKENYNGKEN